MSVLQDEQKAEDELAKKRAAFLLKQQRKAEEARVRKQQLEAEVELKRDEARWVPGVPPLPAPGPRLSHPLPSVLLGLTDFLESPP